MDKIVVKEMKINEDSINPKCRIERNMDTAECCVFEAGNYTTEMAPESARMFFSSPCLLPEIEDEKG